MKLITPPIAEPVLLAEAKLHLKIETTDTAEDDMITMFIKAAREMVEEYTRRALLSQTWELQVDSFSEVVYPLEKTPVISITSVKYYDTAGTEQTLDVAYYILDQGEEPNSLLLASGYTWPQVRGFKNDVKIRWVSGYASSALVPAPLRAAMLLILGHLYENREDVVIGRISSALPKGSEYLMNPYRLFTL